MALKRAGAPAGWTDTTDLYHSPPGGGGVGSGGGGRDVHVIQRARYSWCRGRIRERPRTSSVLFTVTVWWELGVDEYTST